MRDQLTPQAAARVLANPRGDAAAHTVDTEAMSTLGERVRATLTGHAWTVLPHLRHRLLGHGGAPTTDRPWATTVSDPRLGEVRLTGALRSVAGADTLAIVVHGLGGNADAGYCLELADAAARAGWACLRVNLRGADGLGQDLYHAGLVSDVAAVVNSKAAAEFRRIALIGFSLGGHLVLKYALGPDPRVQAVTAVCSPLDLRASAIAFDRRRSAPYRRHVLQELKAAYRTMHRRGVTTSPLREVTAVTKIQDWDARAVVPRFGFANVEDYYARAAVGPHLSALKVPACYVGAPFDPMVPRYTVEASLRAAGNAVTARWIEGRAGHVGFADRTMSDRIVEWTHERRG
ncbi:MAG: alpha/beta fold hydrolase [Nannocystaceae bacterium]|nr:alpha/beta fold hydrolase [Nannocystaceae bacterium]